MLAMFALFRSALPHLFSAFFLTTALVGTWQNYHTSREVAATFESDVRAAQVLNSLFTPSELENGVIISPGPIDERIAFLCTLNAVPWEWMKDPQPVLDFGELPPKTLWVAIKGDYRFVPPAGASTILCPEWQLILLTPRTSAADAPVVDVRGRGQLLELLPPEAWRKPESAKDVPLREVPVPVTPAALNAMRWQGGAGAVSGPASYLEFALPAPYRVAAIQLRYSYQHDNSPATLRALWRRSDQQDFVPYGRSGAVKLPTNPGERTATIWLTNEVIDGFRIHPNDNACMFKLAEIVLLVPEAGQPQFDSGGGEGFLELADAEFIAGWAWDKKQPNGPLLVDIYDGEKKLATAVADQFRADLRDAGIGDGRHGFVYRTPASLKDGKAHTIRVKTSGSNVELDGSPKTLTLDLTYEGLIHQIREVVRTELPPDATVLVVSKGDDDLLKFDGRTGQHFPQGKGGTYDGNPAHSQDAIKRLEALRAKGCQYLLFPEPAFWWLDDYKEFRQHLDGRYTRVYGDDYCIIYRLSAPGEKKP
jgi:hypothetical protein